jgi:hypothetical protein
MLYFQGSESSTSKGVDKIFIKSLDYQNKNKYSSFKS